MARPNERVLLVFVFSVVLLGTVYAQTPSSQLQNGTQGQTGTVTTDSDKIEKTTLEKGMVTLFAATRGYLDLVQPKRLYDVQWFNVTALKEGNIQSISNWQEWANYGIGFAVCVAVGIVFLLVMPIVGLCFGCCRCCGKCGGKAQHMDPKRADCKRNSLAFCLAVLNTVMLAGVICIFLSNEILHNRMQDTESSGVIPTAQRAVLMIRDFASRTEAELGQSVNHAFNNTVGIIKTRLQKSGEATVDKVSDLVNASALIKQAEDLSNEANSTYRALENVKTALDILVNQSRQLSTELTDIKNNVSAVCNSSGTNICTGTDFTQYDTDANFTQLDKLDAQAASVSGTLDMSAYVEQAKNSIESIKSNATQSINSQINSALGQVESIRSDVASGIKSAQQQIQNLTTFAPDFANTLNRTSPDVKKYSNYMWYGGLAVASVFLLIVVLFFNGLLWGQCGSRPGYDAPCCNKGAGANFLMAGVFFCFVLGWILMLVVVVLFVGGGPMYTEVCRYLVDHDPAALQPFEKMVKESGILKDLISGKDINISVVDGLQSCRENKGIFTAFPLDEFYDLDKVMNASVIENEIDKLKDQSITIDQIQLMNPELNATIRRFAAAGLDSINFTSFDEQLQKNLTRVDLGELAVALDAAAASLPSSAASDAAVLRANANALRALKRGLVQDMMAQKNVLQAALGRLQRHMNIKNVTNALLDSLSASQELFNRNGSQLAKEALVNVSDDLKAYVVGQVDALKSTVRNDIGKCRAVFNAFYLASDIVCVSVLDPVNCLWFAMGWCLFFFIPCIILAVKLGDLYRPELPYEEQKHEFDDPNFSMYGTSNHDTIPLTSVNGRHSAEAGYPGIPNAGYYREGSAGKIYDNGYPSHGYEGRGYPEDRYRPAPTPGNRKGHYY